MIDKLISIDLNQTVSKSELKERKTDNLRWTFFALIILSFIVLIAFQTVIIVKSNNLKNNAISFKNHLKEMIDDTKTSVKTSYEDIETLKKFEEEKRIFWGPKLVSLINFLPEDVTITKMEYTKGKAFKMEIFARYDNIEIDDKKTLFLKGTEILQSLKDSDFMDGFISLSAKKSTLEKKKDVELVKFTIEGTTKEILTKKRKKRKRK